MPSLSRCFAIAALAAATGVRAEAADRIEPVTVTASRSAALTESLPTGAVILDRTDIEQSEATHLAGVLDQVAGIDVRSNFGIDGSRSSIDLLGFGAAANSNTLFLLNGHRYSNSDSTVPDLDSIPLAAVERIEVLPGAGAALYGNGAVGGAINIVTRKDYQADAGLQASSGDFRRRGGEAWGMSGNDTAGGALAVDVLNVDGYRENNRLRQHNGFLDLRAEAGGVHFGLTGTAEEQELGLPGGRNADFSSDNTDFEDNPEGADTPNDWANQQSFTLSPRITLPLGTNAALHLDAARRHRSQQAFFDDPSFPFYGETNVDSYNLNPRLVVQASAGSVGHHLTLGWDQYRYDYRSRSAASEAGISDPSSLSEIEQIQDGWYLHDLVTLGEQWSVSVGARELLVDTESDALSGGETDSETDEAMYEGGVRFSPLPGFSLFAGAQRSVRIINADEIRFGNPADFEPQTGRTYTAGASWQEGRQHSKLTLWRGRFEDEIIFDPSVGTFGQNVNLDDPTRRKGVSLNTRWELDDDLMLTLNGTWQRATFESGPWAHNDVPLVPDRTGYLRADWSPLEWLRVSLAHSYTGQRHLDNDQANESPRLDSYRMTDVILRAEHRGVFAEMGVYNLEDNIVADYGIRTGPTTYNAYPLPEKHVIMTVGVEL